MKNSPPIKNKKGSVLVAVLIILIMVAAISMAIISRTTNNVKIASATKKGHSAYQESDSMAEKLLNDIQSLDNKLEEGDIPENKSAADYCGTGTTCYDLDGNEITDPGTMTLANVGSIERTGTDSSTMRAVNVPVPGRIENHLIDIKVDKCGDPGAVSDCTHNRCDVKVSWNKAFYDDSTEADKISGFEVRRSTQKFLNKYDNGGYGWWLAPVGVGMTNPAKVDDSFVIVKNNDDDALPSGEDQYDNQEYFYSVKVKSKQNFTLDSLFWNDGAVGTTKVTNVQRHQVETTEECAGPNVLEGLGCAEPSSMPGVKEAEVSYNCCNGTECYQTMSDWELDPDKECALQKCQTNDTPATGDSGNANRGWCGTAQDCKVGQNCDRPYKTIGYCLTRHAASTQTSYFNSSNWQLSNSVKVYQGPTAPNTQQPRCSKHLCPTDGSVTNAAKCGALPTGGSSWANTSTCSTNNCGPYNFDINCNLSCNSGYTAAESNDDKPQGTCCYRNCPANCTSNCQASPYNCPANPSHGHYEATCATGGCATATYDGRTITCSLKCNNNYHVEGSSCVYNTRTSTCSGSLPSNSSWYNGNTYTQTWSGSAWTPGTQSANFGTGICGFQCNNHYTWNGSSCVADTRTSDCDAKPATGTVWNTVSSITQTWSGTNWSPNLNTTYNTTASTTRCRYVCATNYTWDGSNCVADTRTRNCAVKPANTDWNTVSSITQTWNGTAWSPTNTSTYNITASTTRCRYKCAPGFTRIGSACI